MVPKGPIGAGDERFIPTYGGYIVEISFEKLVLSNRNPFIRSPEEMLVPNIEESITEIPYENIYLVRGVSRDKPHSE